MSQRNAEEPKAFIKVIQIWLAVAAVAWTFSVSAEIVKHGVKLHHLGELAPAIGVLLYFLWQHDLVGTPKR